MRYEMIPRTTMELLDGGFQLYRNHFATFFTLALWIQGPASVLQACVFRVMVGGWSIPKGAEWQHNPGAAVAAVIIYVLISVVTYGLLQTASTYAASEVYHGREVTPKDCIRISASRMATAVSTSILQNLGIMAGSALLIVPGIILTLAWSVSMPVVVLEKRGPAASLGRSRELTRGHRGRMGTLVFLVTVLIALISLGLNSALSHVIKDVMLMLALLQTLPTILMAPLHPAVITLAYYDLRIRKEGYDLEVAAQDAAALPAP